MQPKNLQKVLASCYLHDSHVQEQLSLKVQINFSFITFRSKRIVFIRFVASPMNNCSNLHPANLKYS